MNTDKDRAEFEAWASRQGYKIPKGAHGGYLQRACANVWDAWQARSRSGAVPAVTDAMVERACVAFVGEQEFAMACDRLADTYRMDMRRALEAVAAPVSAPAPSSAEQAGKSMTNCAEAGHDVGIQEWARAMVEYGHGAPSAPAADERSRFEAAMRALNPADKWDFARDEHGYHCTITSFAWEGWQARAQASEPVSAPAQSSFQQRVQPWLLECFDMETCRNRVERNHRFVEEALELAQANGCTQSEAHQLVDYVFGRPAGELPQEVGGVMVTLAALCLACDIDMHTCGETELARIWTKIDAIRAKQAAKPAHSPLPGPSAPADARKGDAARLDFAEANLFGSTALRSGGGTRWFPRARNYPDLRGLTLREAIDNAIGDIGDQK